MGEVKRCPKSCRIHPVIAYRPQVSTPASIFYVDILSVHFASCNFCIIQKSQLVQCLMFHMYFNMYFNMHCYEIVSSGIMIPVTGLGHRIAAVVMAVTEIICK